MRWRGRMPPTTFELAGHAVESGYDLRLVIRELARLTRDLLVVAIDPSRVNDPEIAADGERERLPRAGGAVLGRGSDARLRGADEGGSRHQRVDAAALSPRDGAPALDSPAQARAALEPDSWPRAQAPPAPRRARQAADPPRSSLGAGTDRARPAPPAAGNAATVRAVEARREQAKATPPSAGPSTSRGRCERRRRASPSGTPADERSAALKAAFLAEIRKGEEVLLRHGDRPGAAHRRRSRSHRHCLCTAAQSAARAGRSGPCRRSRSIATRLAGRRIAVVATEIAPRRTAGGRTAGRTRAPVSDRQSRAAPAGARRQERSGDARRVRRRRSRKSKNGELKI